MTRILLIVPTTTYRVSAYLAAAKSLQVEPIIGTNQKLSMAKLVPDTTLSFNIRNPVTAVRKIVEFAESKPFDAIVGVDEETVVLAAMASKALDLPHNPIEAVQATRDKFLMRQKLQANGLPSPAFRKVQKDQSFDRFTKEVNYPCVLKPTSLSASRGVIRVNDASEFKAAIQVIKELLSDPKVIRQGDSTSREILVEDYIPGIEVAVEGVLVDGSLKILAIFDKPDPLEGPYFTETIYTTPSRLSQMMQDEIYFYVEKAVKAIGLLRGPIHAELRINENGIYVVEIANRTIGGYCSEVLTFNNDISLENVVLRQALGMDISHLERETQAAGVMMIPPPCSGTLQKVNCIDEALRVDGIEDILISIPVGQQVEVLPKSSKYLGFIFARGATPEFVENAIRKAYANLEIVIEPDEKVQIPSLQVMESVG